MQASHADEYWLALTFHIPTLPRYPYAHLYPTTRVWKVFTTSESVNTMLRALITAMPESLKEGRPM